MSHFGGMRPLWVNAPVSPSAEGRPRGVARRLALRRRSARSPDHPRKNPCPRTPGPHHDAPAALDPFRGPGAGRHASTLEPDAHVQRPAFAPRSLGATLRYQDRRGLAPDQFTRPSYEAFVSCGTGVMASVSSISSAASAVGADGTPNMVRIFRATPSGSLNRSKL